MMPLQLKWRCVYNFSALPVCVRACARGLRGAQTPSFFHPSLLLHVTASQVDLIEEGADLPLPCYIAASVEWEGNTFGALYPVEAPVSLAMMENDRLVPLSTELETPAVVAAAAEVCAQSNIELVRTPVVLTARGPGLELVDGDAEALEIGVVDDEEETEEALVLAEFSHDGRDILVVQTLDPLYVVGKKVTEKTFTVPTDEEVEEVSDTIEQLVAEFEDAFDDDDDDDDEFDEFDA